MDSNKRNVKTIEVPLYGEVGAGSVVPFTPRNEVTQVAVPTATRESDIGTIIVNGVSLSDYGIRTGDILIFTKRFDPAKIYFEKVCILMLSGELMAKKIIPLSVDKIILRASGGNIPEQPLPAHARCRDRYCRADQS